MTELPCVAMDGELSRWHQTWGKTNHEWILLGLTRPGSVGFPFTLWCGGSIASELEPPHGGASMIVGDDKLFFN
jgi:hypothetical protein